MVEVGMGPGHRGTGDSHYVRGDLWSSVDTKSHESKY